MKKRFYISQGEVYGDQIFESEQELSDHLKNGDYEHGDTITLKVQYLTEAEYESIPVQ